MSTHKNTLDYLKSKIQELHIPLPNFNYFHKPSSEEDVFENFIGREDISEQLEEWLTKGDSGSYLVTGYRGMGKSSFVGKVLNKITRKSRKKLNIQCFTIYCMLFTASSIFSWFFFLFKEKSYTLDFWGWKINEVILSSLLIIFITSASLIVRSLICDSKKKEKEREKLEELNIDEASYQNHKTWFEKVFKIKDIKDNKHNLVIKLNLGHETLREKDILSLIAKRIYDTYKGYLNNFHTNWERIIPKTVFLFMISILLVWFFDKIDISRVILGIKSPTGNIFESVQRLVATLVSTKTIVFPFLSANIIVKLSLSVLFYFVVKRFYNFLIVQIPTFSKHSTTAVLNQLAFLIDRIESSVSENSGPHGVYNHPSSLFSVNFGRRKNKTYSYASTREIEDELIRILEKTQITRSPSLFLFQFLFLFLFQFLPGFLQLKRDIPKFIIVFDELDKIDPAYNQMVKAEQEVPEFETPAAFQGGSAIRNRKQNVLRLLGNMKLFMSQAKAKFVFISGRELYDAFLADLADREFAASSIFNGVIYVDSFLESSTKQKNILTKTEEYICGYLIPTEWYRKKAIELYYSEKGKKIPCESIEKICEVILTEKSEVNRLRLESTNYRRPNLRMYKIFLIETLIRNGYLEKNGLRITEEFENYKEFEKKYKEESSNSTAHLPHIEQLFIQIDKIIVFLNQFSIYLTHVCNGSPKKITIYFEQYIKMFIYGHPKNPFIQSEDKDIKNAEYCLSFTAKEQQDIGFINYMTYPIVQSVINHTSHFGDKMLVSVSFLIDHILKHHEGGFAYENIEHTPELLEVYHIPNLRQIIDTILLFLRQNHITDICGGVYEYKFRKSIADEIEYNSRVSEEIAAIFNFTLDESLPVKRYYYKQIGENEKKYFALEEKNNAESIRNQYAMILVSQLEILAEIHLSDEEYNEAILHFQTAFEIIKSELQKIDNKDKSKSNDKDKVQLYTLLNRTVLKLGLAKECKGYYNEAFVIYNTLLDYFVEFRSLKETELGLNYFYEDNNIVTDKYGEWKAKKTKIFHNYHGLITINDDFYKNEVLPYYRDSETIQMQQIDFLTESDYLVSGLSKVLSPKKQEIISRLTLFSEVKSIFQVILANLFAVEKIGLHGITQENLDLAEDQFKYIYLLTDSKDKFIQAADFYKKMASILFLKNYSNPKFDEYLQMWGFDIYEAINEFCFIRSNKYGRMIAGKFPKEILKEFFIEGAENLWKSDTDTEISRTKIHKLRKKYITDNFKNRRNREIINAKRLIWEFVLFGYEKQEKYLKAGGLERCKHCYEICKQRKFNHPCYACNYVSKSLNVFIQVFRPKAIKAMEAIKATDKVSLSYEKRKSYFFKFLEYFKQEKTPNNHFFILASALRIKADIGLSCVQPDEKENCLTSVFLDNFLSFLDDYYNYKPDIIDDFIKNTIENDGISKLEKTILYYWLSAEYFYRNDSPVDSNECLTKILIIFDKYLKKCIKEKKKTKNLFKEELLEKIQTTIILRALRNSNITNDDVNFIELQNLKFNLKSRSMMRIILSHLSTTANIKEILFAYCKLELSFDLITGIKEDAIYIDCYKSSLLLQQRLSSTIQGKIYSLEFKEKMNMAIFNSIVEKYNGESLDFYGFDSQCKYFSFLRKFFSISNNNTKITPLEKLLDYGRADESENTYINLQMRKLSFLINDSLYCLTQIVEVLSSCKFSNFSHRFIGDIYFQISKWATIYRLTHAVLPKYHKERDEKDINIFIDKEIETMWDRKVILKDINPNADIVKEEFKESGNILTFECNVRCICRTLKECEMTDKILETNILDDIGSGNHHFLIPNYSVAIALKHYRKATETHNEGKEYKEMIRKMYIIDDDISNGMHDFTLALERYAFNCEEFEQEIQKMRKYYKASLSYPLENYLKDTNNLEDIE